MSIIEATYYGVKCDKCGDTSDNGDGTTHWSDPEDAREQASYGEWEFTDGKDYCPQCIDDAMTVASMPDGDLTGRDEEVGA